MSVAEDDERGAEIIIVRRGGGDGEDGHHGGAWKIAFADFMTAMMCFFLVMWLINASNEQTRSALASYFNPVKLVDRNTSSKGIENIGEETEDAKPEEEDKTQSPSGQATDENLTSGPQSHENANDVSPVERFSDESLFSDPYAVLAEIAEDTATQANISSKGEGGAQTAGPSSGASGGESYRDPFAPDFWSQQVAEPEIGVEGDPDQARETPGGTTAETETKGKNPPPAIDSEEKGTGIALAPVPELQPLKPAETTEETASEPASPPDAEPTPTADTASAPSDDTAPEEAEAEIARQLEERPAPDAPTRETEDVAAAIRAEITSRFADSPLAGSVKVVATEEGVMISITDDLEKGMFPVGSAVPERDLVLAMDRIGDLLSNRQGKVNIRGHTDGRPFRSETYDNWRLSTARAQAAYYMLVRGGLDEQRIEQVAGFADRKLKVENDPYASANRRIEILLELPR